MTKNQYPNRRKKYFISYGKEGVPCRRDTVHTAYPQLLIKKLQGFGYVIYMFKKEQ